MEDENVGRERRDNEDDKMPPVNIIFLIRSWEALKVYRRRRGISFTHNA